MTFSPQPSGKGLYEEPAWATRLKEEVGSGTILCLDRSDFDYMQLNTPSTYGIRFAEGYETVTPRRIDPNSGDRFDPQRCADTGISHVLASPLKDPGRLTGWNRIIDSKEFVLYRNPLFQGIASAELVDGTLMPVTALFESPNRREILLPAGVTTLTLLESFNPGWKFSTDGTTWLSPIESEVHGMRIELENPSSQENFPVLLQYHPTYQPYYRSVIGITLAGLIGFSLIRAGRGCRERP
jgi:hypothetical protein